MADRYHETTRWFDQVYASAQGNKIVIPLGLIAAELKP